MHNFVRAVAVLGAGVLLLAAGEAPLHNSGGDLAFLNDIAPATYEPATAPADAFIDETPAFAEPNLEDSPESTSPQATTLAQLVQKVSAKASSLPDLQMDQQLTCLATAVYFESKGEPLDGQLAVAQVILNRVEAGRFGRDICGVVKAPRQFSFVRGGQMPAPSGTRQWETAQAIAMIAVADAWPDIVPAATHFHATRVNPGWKMRRVATVGQHVFYR